MSVAVGHDAEAPPPSRERVELILHQLDRLPTLPPIATRVLAVATSDRSSLRDLVSLIELDPALTAGVLRMVRRSDLGVRQEGMTVSRAVSLVGFDAVRNAVLCSEFFDLFAAPEGNGAAELRKKLWLHSLAVACAAERIAQRVGGIESQGDPFVCGLLHDIGKIALEFCLPKSYQRTVERSNAKHLGACDAERDVFGLDHTVAGKRLIGRWGLPAAVLECAWLHHQGPESLPSFVTSPRMVQIVRAADAMAQGLGFGVSARCDRASTSELAGLLGLSGAAMEELTADVPGRMAPLLEVLGLTDGNEPAQQQALVAAHRHLRAACARLDEDNRRQSARITLFDMVGRFASHALNKTTVGETCAAAAEAVRAALRTQGACVYARSVGRGLTFVAWCDESGECRADVWTSAEFTFPAEGRAETPSPIGIAPAGAGHQSLWNRCFHAATPPALWALAIPVDGMSAGVTLACDRERMQPLLDLAEDWAAVARTFGSAVGSAWARHYSDRTAEELLDLNRRLREAQADLLRVRSIAMVSEMAAGAAHELNNPLAVISGRAQMELSKTDDPDRRRAMDVIIAQTTKAAQIVLDLMNFAKPDPPSPIRQPLAGVLDAVFQHWQSELGSGSARIRIAAPTEGCTVFADTGQLMHALNEVISNALEAADSAEGRVAINSPSRSSDETVRIVIADNGVGMTPGVLEHAIDPFFSSRPAGRGRGLGLSKAYRLAEINGGRLWLESKPNLGTTVTIELPARAPTS